MACTSSDLAITSDFLFGLGKIIFGEKNISSQAIGRAVSKNKLLVIVPCHRVIGSKGDLVGYAGGIDRKKYLLDHEK